MGFRSEGYHQRLKTSDSDVVCNDTNTAKIPRAEKIPKQPSRKRQKRGADDQEDDEDDMEMAEEDGEDAMALEEEVLANMKRRKESRQYLQRNRRYTEEPRHFRSPGEKNRVHFVMESIDSPRTLSPSSLISMSNSGEEDEESLTTDEATLNNGFLLDTQVLLRHAGQIVTQFYHTSADVWDKVLRVVRLLIISRGNFHQTRMSDIEPIFLKTCDLYPGQGVFIIDALSKDPKDRFACANEYAETRFGRFTRQHGGVTRRLFPRSEVWNLLKTAISMISNPEREIELTMHCYSPDGTSLVPCRMWARTVPQYKLVVVRGFVTSEDFGTPDV